MARITNDLDLPQPIVDAIRFDPYTKGDADISVTSAIAPVRQATLLRAHDDELVEDASDRIWSLVGQIGHMILERTARTMGSDLDAASTVQAEKRLFMDVPLPDGTTMRLSGATDHLTLEGGVLRDWKFVSVWSVKDGAKDDWIAQTNLYAELWRAHGVTVERIEVVAVLRDWRKNEALRYGGANGDYPMKQVVVLPIPVWAAEKTRAYLVERLTDHRDARASYTADRVLPPCSAEERWEKPTVYAVMKEGRKSAVKLHATAEAADGHAGSLDKKHYVEVRPGMSVRCQQYCAAAAICMQLGDGHYPADLVRQPDEPQGELL